jgi:hypothetical protein
MQEWQAAQERVFKAMDTDHNGTVTLEEMQAFFQRRYRITIFATAPVASPRLP